MRRIKYRGEDKVLEDVPRTLALCNGSIDHVGSHFLLARVKRRSYMIRKAGAVQKLSTAMGIGSVGMNDFGLGL